MHWHDGLPGRIEFVTHKMMAALHSKDFEPATLEGAQELPSGHDWKSRHSNSLDNQMLHDRRVATRYFRAIGHSLFNRQFDRF